MDNTCDWITRLWSYPFLGTVRKLSCDPITRKRVGGVQLAVCIMKLNSEDLCIVQSNGAGRCTLPSMVMDEKIVGTSSMLRVALMRELISDRVKKDGRSRRRAGCTRKVFLLMISNQSSLPFGWSSSQDRGSYTCHRSCTSSGINVMAWVGPNLRYVIDPSEPRVWLGFG